jgi:hypothetical protein
MHWVTSHSSIAAIAAIDPQIASTIFGTPAGIALGGWPGSVHGRAWASCASFEDDVMAARIPPDVRAVMYDPEGWAATPIEERRDPVTYVHRFVSLAHDRGYFAIVTPHPNLVEVPEASFARAAAETREDAYLRSRIAEESARHTDAFEIQAQRLQNDPDAYRDFVARTAAQARAANPGIVVLSGLSTHPGYAATPQMLHAAWMSVNDVVDGHYLSLAKGRLPRVAARFLRMATGGS